MDALSGNIGTVQPTPSQKEAMTCPTCRQPKEWKGDKPGTAAAPKGKTGQRFRAMQVKRGPGRPRVRPEDKRFVRYF